MGFHLGFLFFMVFLLFITEDYVQGLHRTPRAQAHLAPTPDPCPRLSVRRPEQQEPCCSAYPFRSPRSRSKRRAMRCPSPTSCGLHPLGSARFPRFPLFLPDQGAKRRRPPDATGIRETAGNTRTLSRHRSGRCNCNDAYHATSSRRERATNPSSTSPA